MKKGKRILAIIGILFLVSLYIITLICAITDNTGTMQLFFASVVATVMIPALIWAYTFIYRLIKDGHADHEKEEQDS
ncbi:MAG: hypothetical protein NC180_05045 [Muribaculaceae bacterium]|nr:hypothetical protein [Roseburia sp.]MCM1431155.1 hypothetical protein [Muribaculaceae bacterium]MCM1492578.1 hypothetical protein [Muribaculaceae bacterium]